jgi:hypothetical protein
MSPDARRVVATALVVLTSVLLAAATLAGYARRALFNSDQFADRASATLRDPSVRTLIGDRVTDRVVLANRTDLLAARPIISSAISGIVGGGAFGSLFHRAALDVHRAVFQRDENTITLTVADVGTVAAAAVATLRPSLADDLERSGDVVVVRRKIGSTTGDLARTARNVQLVAWILAALTLVSAAGAVALSVDRRRTIAQLGIGAIVVGVLVIVAYTIARAVVLDHFSDPEERAAAGAVWNTFLGDLRTFGWLLAAIGAVVAAAASSLVRPIEIEGAARRVWVLARSEPRATWLRVVRALVLIALGVLVVLKPLAVVQIVATLVGVYLVYVGVEAILRLIYQPQEQERPSRGRRLRLVAVPIVAVVIVSAATTAFVASGGASAPATTIAGVCDGHAALCDKRLDEVVLPATHNSMSAPLPGWFSAEQDRSIGGQLKAGIRGLLLDTHYGDKLANGRVRTYFGSQRDVDLINRQDGISQQSFEAALRLRERLGFHGKGKRGLYLCHTFCELGFTPLSSGLKDIHDFLVTHPGDIVVVVNQDYVTPEDFVKAVGDAGLTRYVLTPPEGDDWPTLRQMIDSDHRLLFLAENRAGGAPWYQSAYKRLTEETPYTFTSASLLTTPSDLPASCRPNRGPEGAPLFLINHWVSTDPVPKPTDAAKVNAYKPLLARARECDSVRHHLVNLLAVNFFDRGDVFKVVDTLNGVG